MLPEKIGRYKIKRELGHGGMAVVYLGHDTEADRDVAVKVMLPEISNTDPQFKTRFKREAQIIAKFDLPSVVQLYDVGEENGQPYLVMRYMRGGSLHDQLLKEKYTLEKAARLLEQIAPAIDEAHVNGIVHRDIKPGNILFDSRGSPSISDFGIAKVIKTRPTNETNPNLGAPGTPEYMAPEQKEGGSVDGRADIYALGIVLFEMLTGKLPSDIYGTRGRSLTDSGSIPNILDENPNLPMWIEGIISKATARNRKDRYRTAGEMVDAINARLGKTAPAGTRKHFPARRGVWAIAATIISLVLFSGYYFARGQSLRVTTDSSQDSTRPAVEIENPGIDNSQTPIQTDSAALEESSTGTPNVPALPVLGGADKIAFLNNNNIWVMNVDGSDLRSLTNDRTERFNLQWHPDGDKLLYITGKTIKSIDINTKEETVVTGFGASNYFEAFRISPDGKQVAISLARELHVVPFDLDKIRKAATKDDLLARKGCLHFTSEEVEDIRWSKDGKKLAIIFAASTIKNLEDYIRIIDIQFCNDTPPLTVDEFPSGRFDFFTDEIVAFDWNGEDREDGNSLFIMNSNKRNNGFGRLGVYNSGTFLFTEIAPIDGICCYRDAFFSPDGQYLLFAFQDIRLGEHGQITLYYLPYASLESNGTFSPLPLPDGFFIKRSDSPSPVLRPAK